MALSHWLRLRGKQLFYALLARVYGFDKWHYRVVRENCGYFRRVKALHDELDPVVTIDIGCGLGEIVTGLKSKVRIGIDMDPAVIQAARLVHGRRARFFSLYDCPDKETYVAERRCVCLLFLNWFHSVTADDVRQNVRAHVARFRPTHMIFDVIDRNAASYRYKHDPQLLSEFGKVAALVDAGDHVRNLVVVEVR
jgi:hypothetical protein